VPDFRSGLNTALKTGPGLWAAQADYEKRTNGRRDEFTKNDPTRPRVDLDAMIKKQPTFTHKALSKLVEKGYLKTILTQNVDNLHRKSGVDRKNLVELHGNLQCEVCDSCGMEYERDFRIGPNSRKGAGNHFSGRYCDRGCGGRLKDYLVPFGEDLPKTETDRAWRESELADFCLAIGSSMTVTPACDYAGWVSASVKAKFNHPPNQVYGSLAVINIQKTPYDKDAEVVLHGYCDEAMRYVMEELGIDVGEMEVDSCVPAEN